MEKPITATEYLNAIEICKLYRKQLREELEKSDFVEDEVYTENTSIFRVNMSVRLLNIWNTHIWRTDVNTSNITLGDIKKIPLVEWRFVRNFGEKCEKEHLEILSKIHPAGVTFNAPKTKQ